VLEILIFIVFALRLQELEAEVAARKREFEELGASAQQISRATGDNRTASYAAQLLNRFQTLSESVRVS